MQIRKLRDVVPALGVAPILRAQCRAVRGDRDTAAKHHGAGVEKHHDRLGQFGVAVELVPRLEELDEYFGRRDEHGYLLKSFIAAPLTTVTPMAESATVRCSFLLSRLCSAWLDSVAPAQVKA